MKTSVAEKACRSSREREKNPLGETVSRKTEVVWSSLSYSKKDSITILPERQEEN